MRTVLILALFVGVMLAFGCLGGGSNTPSATNTTNASAGNQFPNPGQGATPSIIPNIPSTPPANPQTGANNSSVSPQANNTQSPNTPPSANTAVVIDAKKAMKISMLRKGDSMGFDNWQIQLKNITFVNKPIAYYAVLDANNAVLQNFSLAQNGSFRYTAPNGEDYIFVSIFVVGNGLPNSVQTQVYRVKDLTASNSTAQISTPQNSYPLWKQYPAPVMLANKTMAVGETVSGGGISVMLNGIDRSTTPAGAQLVIMDETGAEMGTVLLQGGQLVEIRMDKQTRYDVILQPIDATSGHANVLIYRVLAFSDASGTISSG